MIPKKIHYCWFGRVEKPKLVKKCIASWQKFCPDYEIIEWNEDNFNLNYSEYTRYCYDNKKWAFLSDVVRLIVVSKYGGIYFDTDVELVRNPDNLLNFEAFYGFENTLNVNTGLGFGSVKHHITVEKMIEQYKYFKKEINTTELVACPKINTKVLNELGLELNGNRQNVCGAEVLPIDFMNPYDDPTGKLNITKNTISIHWYSKSWMSKGVIIKSKIAKPFHRLFGVNCFSFLRRKNKNRKV